MIGRSITKGNINKNIQKLIKSLKLMKAKVCGLSNAEHVKTCVDLGVNYCGFILNYPKSHRFVKFEKAKELTSIKKENKICWSFS